jgi:protein SCO1
MPVSPSRVLWIMLIVAGLAAGVGGAYLISRSVPDTAATLPPGGDFTLKSAAGPVALKDLRGKVVLVYFGYTHCPDICPTSLAAVAKAISALTPAERDKVAALMISVDPPRDTPERMREYVSFFHPKMVGLVGAPAETEALAVAYGAGYTRAPVRPDGGYLVDHAAGIYVVDPAGRLCEILHIVTTDAVLAAVRKHLA